MDPIPDGGQLTCLQLSAADAAAAAAAGAAGTKLSRLHRSQLSGDGSGGEEVGRTAS